MSQLIQPRTLKGFRDYLPDHMIPREALIDTARGVYRSFGFLPIETPALEYAEILCGKGSEETDRQMYRFRDHGDRDVGMRFDLTVPLARFVAQHAHSLGMPFKRYHIATVWRGENTQAGRYREFMQCDFDTIGTTSMASDIETALVIFELMKAIGFERFKIQVNNRKVLNGVLQKFDLLEHSVAVLRALDKLSKIGTEQVHAEMTADPQITGAQADQILQLAKIQGSNDEALLELDSICGGNELAEQGLAELRQLIQTTARLGIGESNLQIDVSIARGLDYYTGTIFETILDDLPRIGSVCSGGRYDNLAELYSKQQLPGIGASLGLDRLLTAMETLEMLPERSATADILVVQFDRDRLADYLEIAHRLRQQGIATEVYPEARKVGQQFKYADRRGIRAVLLAGPDELEKGVVQVKWMSDGSQQEFPLDDQVSAIGQWISEKNAPN